MKNNICNQANKIFNFNSGPAMLPAIVLSKIEQELRNWHNLGFSIMEISHRSKEFTEVMHSSEQDLRELLNIPDNYKVLFCQGGARTQFAAIPMNLLGKNNNPDYIYSGYWSYCAIKEAQKYCKPKIIDVTTEINGKRAIKSMNRWNLSDNSTYVHYCPNETIDGIAITESPNFDNKIIVADFSSTILSYPLDISRFGVIYAAAQKNIGPSGITLVIIRDDLINYTNKYLPSTLNYKIISENNSIFNTPPTFAWYVSGLVFKWLKTQGGILKMSKRNKTKASIIYNVIDKNNFIYRNTITSINRSSMNIPFQLVDKKLDELFLQKSEDAGLYGLKGHRTVGGIRASLYNAMTIEGAQYLMKFMEWFAQYYG